MRRSVLAAGDSSTEPYVVRGVYSFKEKEMNLLKTLVATVALFPIVAGAQSVNQRQAEQHRRIVQGIHSGALTRHEASRLRHRESVVRAQERRDRFMHHGHLTSHERARLNRELNHDSRAIYSQKHDAQHRHY